MIIMVSMVSMMAAVVDGSGVEALIVPGIVVVRMVAVVMAVVVLVTFELLLADLTHRIRLNNY
jgi:hypothetical protein